jgi:hypothetical protein
MLRTQSAAVRVLLALTLVVTALGAGCSGIAPSGFSGDVDELLASGQAYADFVVRQPAEVLSAPDVLAVGYLERARLGLGSPFRLIDFALRDPQLPEDVRERLAFALLARVLRGETYQVDPAVLEYVQLPRVRPGYEVGERQLQLIERTIDAAPSARSGEQAVRLGYRLAQAEKTVLPVPFSVVAHTAAMVADRRRAREDAVALLRAAVQQSASPLDLLVRWRADLRFQVEGPVLKPASVREEEWEARDGPQVALALRTLAQRLGASPSLVHAGMRREDPERRSILTPETASRMLRLAEQRDYPAQAPLAVALSLNREAFLDRVSLPDPERAARQIFLDRSWNEERLVAEARMLSASGAAEGRRLPLILLQAANFFRVWNQEEPWFPGDPAPAARDLEARFGLAAIEFDDSVPASWRPFYLRMLGRGLGDLQRVLPTASVRGLRIRIGELPQGVHALALHDPSTRTLVLPPRTGSGTLAHEIAHDLDWQLARKRYGRRGGYATDLSVRRGSGDRIATSLSGLAASLIPPVADSPARPHDTRPAEVFARGSDWLVAVMLAQQGRSGGYLTSYQDAALTGYGTTRGPDIDGGAVPSLLSILDAIAPILEGPRQLALDQFGPNRTLSPTETVRAILRVPADRPAADRMAAIVAARDRALSSLSGVSCRLSSAQGLRRLIVAQRGLIQAGTRAALRGAVIDGLHSAAEEALGESARPAVDAWLARRLYGAPEPTDSVLDPLIPVFEDILLRAEELEREEPAAIGSLFSPQPGVPLCAVNPFASELVPAPRRTTRAPTTQRPAASVSDLASRMLPVTPWHAVE